MMNKKEFDFDTTTSTSSAVYALSDELITLEKILHAKEILKKFERPTIYIWNGLDSNNSDMSVDKMMLDIFQRHVLLDKPQIIDSDYILDVDKFYILAGTGIVASKKVADTLRALDLNLLWSDTPTDLEEQEKMFKEIFDRLFE